MTINKNNDGSYTFKAYKNYNWVNITFVGIPLTEAMAAFLVYLKTL